jgi:hypothetical protein
VIGDSPGGLNTYSDNQMPSGGGGRTGREPRYCPVKTSDPSVAPGEENIRYKTIDSTGLPNSTFHKTRVIFHFIDKSSPKANGQYF